MSRWLSLVPQDPRWSGRSRAFARGLILTVAVIAPVLVAGGPVRAATPAAASTGTPALTRASVPVRIRIETLGIDLPILSSDAELRGNTPGYPLCDVAQYWTRYDLPGAPGTTWIFAHAQPGMFLPLLEVAEATDGTGLLGLSVSLQLADGRLLTYRIDSVRQHAVDRSIARDRGAKDHRLVLQTSEGPSGTIPKLQMAGTLMDAARTDESAPEARPRVCSRPSRTPGPGRRNGEPARSPPASASAGPAPIEIGPMRLALGDASLDELIPTTLGAGLLLVGTLFLAWGILGRKG